MSIVFAKRHFSASSEEFECAVLTFHQTRINVKDAFGVVIDPYRSSAAAIVLPSGRFFVGVSTCSPSDQFIKAVGREKAIKRAFHAYSDQTYAKNPDPTLKPFTVDLKSDQSIKFVIDQMKLSIAETHKQLIEARP